MIISQTPFRMSFVGGGSDFSAFYREFGGAVVSTTIDKFVYIAVNRKFDDAIRVSYSKTEEVDSLDRLEHKLVRESLRMLQIPGGVEITSIADIPSRGTGLGSSSAFTAGLLNALHGYRNEHISCEELGRESCKVEIELCGAPIGKQDQYAAAFGGLNFIRFESNEAVIVQPIICAQKTLDQLQRSLVIFYTGSTRDESSFSTRQTETPSNHPARQKCLQRMAELAHVLRDELQANRLDSFGKILHENWMLKRETASDISNQQVDHWYERACNAGAQGGKLLGAGGGGFLIFFAPPDRHDEIAASLTGLRRMHFQLEPRGSRIILYQP